jgi:hypothetical protein
LRARGLTIRVAGKGCSIECDHSRGRRAGASLVAEGAASHGSQEACGTSIAAAENRRARDVSHPNPAAPKERRNMDSATPRRPAPPLSFNRREPAERRSVPGTSLSFPAEHWSVATAYGRSARGRESRWIDLNRSDELGPLPSLSLRSSSPGMTMGGMNAHETRKQYDVVGGWITHKNLVTNGRQTTAWPRTPHPPVARYVACTIAHGSFPR